MYALWGLPILSCGWEMKLGVIQKQTKLRIVTDETQGGNPHPQEAQGGFGFC